MSGGDSATVECKAGPSTPTRTEEGEKYHPEAECRVRKKRAPPNQRERSEYGRWDRDEFSQDDIDKKISDIMDGFNRDAGLGTI